MLAKLSSNDYELPEWTNLEFKVFRSLKEIARRREKKPSLCLQDEGVLPYSLVYHMTPVKKEVMKDRDFYGTRLDTEFQEVSSLEAMKKEYCRFAVIAFSDQSDSELTVNLLPHGNQEEQKGG